MHPEVEELRPKLKELLYDCAVDIKATKAALFLFDGTSKFELVTEYGFRGAVRHHADLSDPIVDRCGRGRNAFFINGVGTEPRFSQLLFEASTDRLLVAPLYSRGKLVGLIDMRDKAGKQPFDQGDIPRAMNIAERIVDLFANKNLFGHQFISLSDIGVAATTAPPAPDRPTAVSGEPPLPAQVPPVGATPAQARRVAEAQPVPVVPAPAQTRGHVPRLATLVLEARTMASGIVVPTAPESLSEHEINAVRDVLKSILLIPSAVAAAFSAFGHLGGIQEIASRGTLAEDAKGMIQSKLNVWLTKRGDAAGYVRTNVTTPFGTSGPPVGAAELQKVFTAPVVAGPLRGLYLTVAFATNPDRIAHELLAVLLSHLQLVIEQSIQRETISSMRSALAVRLVEPDFLRYPELRRHSEAVAAMSESFARYLMLSPHEIENARLVGLVHDAGMRLLDYERLYRKKDLTTEELGFLREHPSVGAVLVEPLLGKEVARAVLSHHERPDGRGYPNELQRDEIPMLSRIVQICDAWVAMTDPDTYQPVESHPAALATISNVAGSQFDHELAGRFVEMMRGR